MEKETLKVEEIQETETTVEQNHDLEKTEKHDASKKYKKMIKTLEEKLETLTTEIEFQKSLRNADIANLTKKRNEQENVIRKYASSNLAQDLIKPFDLLKKVVEAPTTSKEVQNYLLGFTMVINQIENAFASNGIKPMGVKSGDEFDSKFHEANELLEDSTMESNKIIGVISDGYMIHDRVLVHAIVKVNK